MTEYLNLLLATLRLATAALTAMGAVAVLLCALGLYGLPAYTTTQRIRQIGIRMALGATARDVLAAVGRRIAVLVPAGGVAGLALAWLSTRLLGTLRFGAAGAGVFLAAAALLVAIAALAALAPMRRALRIEPAAALRSE